MSPPPRTTIAAVLLPTERSAVDAASAGHFEVLHRDSIPDALRVVRERRIDAVILSVNRAATEQIGPLHHLVRGFPGLPTVAVMTGTEPVAPGTLLRLGASGVREVVDVSTPNGWGRLRNVVTPPTGRAAARILAGILDALPALPSDARHFLETLVRRSPSVPVVRALAREFGMPPSTLMSRFARAGLPSPKAYLASIRLLHAAWYFGNDGLSIADVSYRLEYSSPQSFGRHLRSMLGLTCSEFRRRFPFTVALDRFIRLMIAPHADRWAQFHPLTAAGDRHTNQLADARPQWRGGSARLSRTGSRGQGNHVVR